MIRDSFERERETRRLLRSVRFMGGLTVLVMVAVLAVLVSGRSQRAREQPLPTTANATEPPPVVIVTNGATGTLVDFRDYLGAVVKMGKKTQENWVPNEPLPFQKLAKDCDRELGEEAINGGCWFGSSAVAPPCGKLYRYGDRCYRPLPLTRRNP